MERKEELFDMAHDEPEMLHSVLSKLPKPLDLEGWIARAIRLLDDQPPERLSTWRRVSRLSVLKTSRQSDSLTLAAAEDIFRRQSRELALRKHCKDAYLAVVRHRKPLLLGLSLAVGLSSVAWAVYSRHHGGGSLVGLLVAWRKLAAAAVRKL